MAIDVAIVAADVLRLTFGSLWAEILSVWAPVSEPGFLDFQISRFSIFEVFCSCNIILKHMLVRYRGINNKGVLDRPWTIWKVLKAISNTLKFKFPVNSESLEV